MMDRNIYTMTKRELVILYIQLYGSPPKPMTKDQLLGRVDQWYRFSDVMEGFVKKGVEK